MSHKRNHTNYLPSLDGVRALAIIFVLLYHFKLPLFSGGFIGVDIFFVLSGYLITSKLLSAWRSHQTIDIKHFWIKRIRRLIPAVVVLLITMLIFTFIFFPKVFAKSWTDGIASFFYINNWWYIFNDVPYFQSFGTPSPFKHLWSLAIEEQFYLIWPIAFLTLLNYFKKRQHVLKVVLLSGLASIILMFLLYDPTNIDRVYYGTDTRLFTLAIGCSLAFVWPFYLLEDNFNKKESNVIDGIGLVSLIGLITFAFTLSEYKRFLYPTGFIFVALLAALLLAVVAHPSSRLAKVFSLPAFVYLGQRSYSLYLWHYPIVVLFTPVKTIGTLHPFLIILQLLLIIILAEASYRFVEMPFIKYGYIGVMSRLKTKNKQYLIKLAKFLGVILVLTTVLTLYSGYLSNGYLFKKENPVKNTSQTVQTETKESETAVSETVEKPKKIKRILAIGDSVLLGVKEQFELAIPGVVVDAEVGRQLVQAEELVKEKYSSFNSEDSLIFLELGSNSRFEKKELDSLLKLFDKSLIYLVNTKVPRDWESEVNRMLKDASNSHENVKLIDWNKLAKEKPAILTNDGIHITPDHVEDYLKLYTDQIKHHDVNLKKEDNLEKN